MRPGKLALALAVLAALLAPEGAAQEPVVRLVTLDVEPFEGLAPPLQGPIVTTFETRLSCLLADATGLRVQNTLVDAPAWASVVVSPALETLPAGGCDAGWVTTGGSITVTASAAAPAFTATPIVLEVLGGEGARAQSARGQANLSASYFALVDVQVEESVATLAPGESVAFRVRVTNLGNDDTRVSVALMDGAAELAVDLPAPIVLESAQQGGTRVTQTLEVRVSAPEEDGAVHRVSVVNVGIQSTFAENDAFMTDVSSASFLVNVRSGGAFEAAAAPAPAWAALLALAACAVLIARR